MAKQMGRVIVVGLSGSTNSGKSTLAVRLVEKFTNCTTVCQDTYFLAPNDPRLDTIYIPEMRHHNWEDFRALEMEKMVCDIKQQVAAVDQIRGDNNYIIIVEGFSIFGWRPLASLFDLKYFLSVDKEVCFERRKHRDYNPPDNPGYFEKIVWPMHIKHLNLIKDQTDIVYLDGNETLGKHFSRLMSDLADVANTADVTSSQ